jgi:ParB/RepB/Spo0J family partition protein
MTARAALLDTPHMYEGNLKLPVDRIRANPANPRRDTAADDAMVASIKAIGIIEPLVVRALQIEDAEDGCEWELLAGHRRLDGAIKAGFSRVPAVVRHVDPAGALEVMLVENLARQDLSPLEEAAGIAGLAKLGHSQRQLAGLLGVSQSHISKRLGLLKLPDKARSQVDSGGITIEAAQALAALPPKKVEPLFAGTSKPPTPYQIARVVEEYARDEKIRLKVEECKKAGVACEVGHHSRTSRPLAWMHHVDAKAHKQLPCHLVLISPYDGSVQGACTDPDSHPAPESEDSPSPEAEKAREARRAEDDRAQATQALRDAGRQRRVAFCKELIGRPCSNDIVALAAHVLPEISDPGLEEALKMVGIDGDVEWDEQIRYLQAFAGDDIRTQMQVLYAITLTSAEGFTPEASRLAGRRTETAEVDETDTCLPVVRRYLRHLVDKGYECDLLEGEMLEGFQLALPVDPPAPAPEIVITAKGKRFMVACSDCGDVGFATTDSYARLRGTNHLSAEHGVVVS